MYTQNTYLKDILDLFCEMKKVKGHPPQPKLAR